MMFSLLFQASLLFSTFQINESCKPSVQRESRSLETHVHEVIPGRPERCFTEIGVQGEVEGEVEFVTNRIHRSRPQKLTKGYNPPVSIELDITTEDGQDTVNIKLRGIDGSDYWYQEDGEICPPVDEPTFEYKGTLKYRLSTITISVTDGTLCDLRSYYYREVSLLLGNYL